MNNIKGSLILLLVAFIWGTAFVAQTSGAGAVGTFTFNAARSIVGALFLAVVIIIKNVLDKRNNSGKVISTENGSRLQTWPLGAGIICGIVLFAAMTFHQTCIKDTFRQRILQQKRRLSSAFSYP